MHRHTAARRPSEKISNEADRPQLELAKKQGAAQAEAIRHMANEVADTGGEQAAGEYIVSYALEEAEGLYFWEDGGLVWREPDKENLHVEIAVRDSADNRIVPELNVEVTLIDSKGNALGPHRLPLLWHPCVYHYGRDWQVPGDGEYTIRVMIDPPHFPRHDRTNGCRFTERVEVTFANVQVRTGQKRSE